jgi:hypothetical protein
MIRTGNRSGSRFSDWGQAQGLEDDVLHDPIRTLDDVLAKLRAVELVFAEGERTDGADAMALRQTIQWLQAHAGQVGGDVAPGVTLAHR